MNPPGTASAGTLTRIVLPLAAINSNDPPGTAPTYFVDLFSFDLVLIVRTFIWVETWNDERREVEGNMKVKVRVNFSFAHRYLYGYYSLLPVPFDISHPCVTLLLDMLTYFPIWTHCLIKESNDISSVWFLGKLTCQTTRAFRFQDSTARNQPKHSDVSDLIDLLRSVLNDPPIIGPPKPCESSRVITNESVGRKKKEF